MVLTVLVHLIFVLILFLGMSWKSKPEDDGAMEVDLVSGTPVAGGSNVVEPTPVAQPKPPEPRPTSVPPPQPTPKPPPPVVRPPEPPPTPQPKPPEVKPDIAIKPPEKTKPKPEPKPEVKPPPVKAKPLPAPDDDEEDDEPPSKVPPKPTPKPVEKPVEKKPEPVKPLKPAADDYMKNLLNSEAAKNSQAKEKAAAAAEQKRISDLLNREGSGAGNSANGARAGNAGGGASVGPSSGYIAAVSAKVKRNSTLPAGVSGNPTVVFDVTQLEDGTVLSVRLNKSSGNSALDDAMERAIQKSSPLPPDPTGRPRPRELRLKFNPLQE